MDPDEPWDRYGGHLESVECWCCPEVEWVDPDDEDAGYIVIHRDRSESN